MANRALEWSPDQQHKPADHPTMPTFGALLQSKGLALEWSPDQDPKSADPGLSRPTSHFHLSFPFFFSLPHFALCSQLKQTPLPPDQLKRPAGQG